MRIKQAKTTKGKLNQTKGVKMNLKRQIAFIVLALQDTSQSGARTNKVTITDSPTPSGYVARYQNLGRLYNGQDILSFGYHDLQPKVALTPLGSHLVAIRSGDDMVFVSASHSHNYSIVLLFTAYNRGRRF